MKARTQYDPWNREDADAEEAQAAARYNHEQWSLEQSKRGQSAAQRDDSPTWVKRQPALDLETH